jgi:hypothetical protein
MKAKHWKALHKQAQSIANAIAMKSRQAGERERHRAFEAKQNREFPGSIPVHGSSFTAGEAIKALKKLPPDAIMWVCANPNGEVKSMSGCGYIGYRLSGLYGHEEASQVAVFAMLSPEREEANRQFKRDNPPKSGRS